MRNKNMNLIRPKTSSSIRIYSGECQKKSITSYKRCKTQKKFNDKIDRRHFISKRNLKETKKKEVITFQPLPINFNRIPPMIFGGGYFHKVKTMNLNNEIQHQKQIAIMRRKLVNERENLSTISLPINCRNIKIHYRSAWVEPKKTKKKNAITIFINLNGNRKEIKFYPRSKNYLLKNKNAY